MNDIPDHLVRTLDDMLDRIAALEASICYCRDCEVHREKAATSSRANVAAETRRKVGA